MSRNFLIINDVGQLELFLKCILGNRVEVNQKYTIIFPLLPQPRAE